MKVLKAQLSLFVALFLVDVALQSDIRRRQTDPCPDGWERLGNLSSCYLIGNVRVKWADAVGLCLALGARLIEPDDEMKESAIVSVLRSRGTSAVWTGGHSIFYESNWLWLTGHRDIGYTDWYPPNPSDTGGIEWCIEIRPAGGYRWNDIDCDTKNKFVCEKRF